MPSVTLDAILTATRARVEETMRTTDPQALRYAAERHIPRGFKTALESRSQTGLAVIAELKKASPSRGPIRGSFPVAGLALELEQAGAAAISILTEPDFFDGSLANLCEASAAVAVPCLRKEFVVHEFQILEARAYGADAILLIVAALTDEDLRLFSQSAKQMQLDVLCEVHDERELERALATGCEMIGVNSRNLRTFKVDDESPLRLARKIPTGVLAVAESGIQSGEQLRRLADAGYRAFLIGESLMRAESPGAALRKLLANAGPAR